VESQARGVMPFPATHATISALRYEPKNLENTCACAYRRLRGSRSLPNRRLIIVIVSFIPIFPDYFSVGSEKRTCAIAIVASMLPRWRCIGSCDGQAVAVYDVWSCGILMFDACDKKLMALFSAGTVRGAAKLRW
jgi:hypothetical protein